MNISIPLIVIIPLIAALFLNLFAGKNKIIKVLAFIVGLGLPILTLTTSYGLHYFGGHQPLALSNIANLSTYITNSSLYNLHPAITYAYTPIAKVFIFALGIVVFLSIFSYLNSENKASGPFLFMVFMATASVSALLLSDDLFNMYVFFEIAALIQTGIIIASSAKDNYETALKYMILSSIGGPILLLGITILLAICGSVNITDISLAISNLVHTPEASGVVLFAFSLIFFGWLYASGLPPFNVIKSLVYSKAEPYGSSVLQAMSLISLIAFIIAMFRIFGTLDIFKGVMIFISIASMILGVSMFVGLGFGIGGNFAITAGLFQGLNEMIVTTLLFIGLGTVVYLTNTSDTRKLGGLIGKNTFMAIMILLGGLTMAGVPPFNGFRSKLMIVEAALNTGFPEIAVIIILISIATFFVFVKAFHSIFLKPQPRDLTFIRDSIPKSILFTVLVLLIICLILGLYPELVTNPISQSIGGLL